MGYSRKDLLDLVRRNVDADGWLDPIRADPNGEAALQGLAGTMKRASQAVDRIESIGSPSSAPGGDPGTSTVTIARGATGTSGTIPAGYRFLDARGVVARVATAVPVLAASASLQVPLVTDRQSELVNTPVDPVWRVHPGETVILDVTSTTAILGPLASTSMVPTAFQPGVGTMIEGGASDWLSLHGKERGANRQPNEATGAYRPRVRNIPDAVSPIGVADGVQAPASALNLGSVQLQEPFDDGASAALRADHGIAPYQPLYTDGNSAPESPFHSEYLDDYLREMVDRRTARGYFRMVVPQPTGPTGAPAFIVAPQPVATLPSDAMMAALLTVYDEAGRKKAGGVNYDVFVGDPTVKVGVGSTASNADTVVFTLQPIPGRAWYLRTAHLGHDSSPSGVALDPTSMTHRVTFTFTDATTFTTPAAGQIDEERLDPYKVAMAGFPYTKRINKVEGKLHADGTHAINLVGTFYVTEVVDP